MLKIGSPLIESLCLFEKLRRLLDQVLLKHVEHHNHFQFEERTQYSLDTMNASRSATIPLQIA
jgi:hypothetical protein